MSAEETRQIVYQMLGALDRADWAALEQHPGLYETRQNYRLSKTAVPDSRHEVIVEVLQDDLMACVATVTGTHMGHYWVFRQPESTFATMSCWLTGSRMA